MKTHSNSPITTNMAVPIFDGSDVAYSNTPGNRLVHSNGKLTFPFRVPAEGDVKGRYLVEMTGGSESSEKTFTTFVPVALLQDGQFGNDGETTFTVNGFPQQQLILATPPFQQIPHPQRFRLVTSRIILHSDLGS